MYSGFGVGVGVKVGDGVGVGVNVPVGVGVGVEVGPGVGVGVNVPVGVGVGVEVGPGVGVSVGKTLTVTEEFSVSSALAKFGKSRRRNTMQRIILFMIYSLRERQALGNYSSVSS